MSIITMPELIISVTIALIGLIGIVYLFIVKEKEIQRHNKLSDYLKDKRRDKLCIK